MKPNNYLSVEDILNENLNSFTYKDFTTQNLYIAANQAITDHFETLISPDAIKEIFNFVKQKALSLAKQHIRLKKTFYSQITNDHKNIHRIINRIKVLSITLPNPVYFLYDPTDIQVYHIFCIRAHRELILSKST
ncbi:hypothetical protein K4L44_04400 [Halosquirtibacter laminarini]|uniref:Uncharacterized protein n=1 Tax=Halosquirtibacter laminarini TaxID=3374600 RepID=A0AC61NHD3_9BACT|nr:hypothetical protein K4L44_04400 [Prolixibacteraceae bacterium]